ncbi:MAG TPA: hypothetical protein VHE61_21985 [Opitutaceae bacterium]|nr:hypothetical protein [Opitutaceae bacterium]
MPLSVVRHPPVTPSQSCLFVTTPPQNTCVVEPDVLIGLTRLTNEFTWGAQT